METSTITADEIMTRHLVVTSADTHVMDAIERLIAHRVSGLPVMDESGQFVGRFSERTAIAALDSGTINSNTHIARRLRDVAAVEIMDRSTPVLCSSLDVFHCINELILKRVSGAPVIDSDGSLRGVFSEQSAMHVFIGLCWEQLPSSLVTAWLDRHDDRRIREDTTLVEILDRFQRTPFRRLMVLRGNKLVGQVTRQDALLATLQNSREPLATQLIDGERQGGQGKTVASWMQGEAVSTRRSADVVAIAQQFLQSSARQLPVLDNGRIEGQISRSDLLRAVQRFFPPDSSPAKGASPLYLSSIDKRGIYAVT